MTLDTSLQRPPAQRLHGLDTLRALALGLGILLHSLLPFQPDGYWLFSDDRTTPAAKALVDGIHLFRMVLFMALAGYFGRMVLQRRGTGSYVKDRLLRVGLPAVLLWPLAVAPVIAFTVFMAMQADPAAGSTAAEATVADAGGVLTALLVPGHLWFLWVLLQCVVVTVLVRLLLVRVLGADRAGRAARRLGDLLATPLGIAIAAVPYAAGLLLQESIDAGLREPFTVLPELSSLTAYLGAFLVGWFLHAGRGSLDRIGRRWPGLLAIAAVFAVVTAILQVGAVPTALHAAAMALGGWSITYALLALSVRFLRRENRLMRYLADASYWNYLMHLPIVLVIGYALSDLDWPVIAKLLVTWTATAVLLLVPYDLIVRSTWIGKWLNGHRRRRALAPGRRAGQPIG